MSGSTGSRRPSAAPMCTTGASGTDSRSRRSARRRTSRSRRPTASAGSMSTTSSASSKPGPRASTWPSSSSTSEWPSKISSSWPPTALQKATKQRVVSRARGEHLLPLAVAADVERRGREVRQELRAREREVGRGRPRLPHVLADRRADQRAAVLEEEQVASRREVAVLVEDAVVRQEALAVDRLHLAAGADRARVVEVAVEVGVPDERGDPVRGARDLAERLLGGAHEPGPQEQVLGRVAGDGELGEEDEVGAGGLRLLEPAARMRARLPSRSPTVVLIWASASLIAGFRLSVENLRHRDARSRMALRSLRA